MPGSPEPRACRICHASDARLVQLECACGEGTAGLVHAHCLSNWVAVRASREGDAAEGTTQATTCEICNEPFGGVVLTYARVYALRSCDTPEVQALFAKEAFTVGLCLLCVAYVARNVVGLASGGPASKVAKLLSLGLVLLIAAACIVRSFSRLSVAKATPVVRCTLKAKPDEAKGARAQSCV